MSNTTKRRPRAHVRWTLPLLLDTLRRQGWGALDGKPWKGLRAVLAALCARLDYRSGEGTATVEQIATGAGYGMRWTRTQLATLEEIGLIHWDRGGVQYGKPVPSRFRISKSFLVDLIESARDRRTAEMIELAVKTQQRLEKIRTIRMVKGKRKTTPAPVPGVMAAPARAGSSLKVTGPRVTRMVHVAVAANPSPRRGTLRGAPFRESSSAPPSDALASAQAQGLSGPALARQVLASLGRARQ